MVPTKATATENKVVSAIAADAGKNLFCLAIDIKGSGKSIKRNAVAEKDEPVGVKFTACAKSKGK